MSVRVGVNFLEGRVCGAYITKRAKTVAKKKECDS